MIHSICEFAFVHRYLTATVLVLAVALVLVQGGRGSLERTGAVWQQAHAERIAVVDQ